MKKAFVTVVILATMLTGCDTGYQLAQQVNSTQLANRSSDENVNLTNLMAQLFEERLALNPIEGVFIGDFRFNDGFVDNLSDEYLERRHELNARYQALSNSIDRDKLSNQHKISYDILRYDLTMALQAETYPEHFMPFNQFSSLMSTMAQLGSGQSAQPFATAENYYQFAKRLEGYVKWFATAQQRLSQGIANKVVLPRVLALRILPQLKAQLVANVEDSIFYQPLKMFPAALTSAERQAITELYQPLISQRLLPAYQRMVDFLNEQYIPNTRSTAGFSGLPNGGGWYQFKANQHTTTNLPVGEIHQIGLAEVKRISLEMDKVRQQVKFEGNLSQFFAHMSNDQQYFYQDKSQLIQDYTRLKEQVAKVIPDYFDVIPDTRYQVKAVESFREKSAAGASYQAGSIDGTRAGVFYVNTYNLKAQPKWGMMTLSLHEAMPGHHLQVSIRQSLLELPKLQRFNGYAAYAEGWALYSEHLGVEMGLYSDPYLLFGKLADEMLRAMRLVVDTGLHVKGWSRDQAIQYMLKNSAMARSDVEAEVERYMALPGQALSYKVGQLKILALRTRAENELGESFDLKQFHNQILLDGALPLDILERKIVRWIGLIKNSTKP